MADRAVLFPGEECLACNWRAGDDDFNETTTGSLEPGEANAPSAASLAALRADDLPFGFLPDGAGGLVIGFQNKAARKAAKKAEKARRKAQSKADENWWFGMALTLMALFLLSRYCLG